jgi:hypothetical protein
VRLRENCSAFSTCSASFISIPSGAIKSSRDLEGNWKYKSVFQFLLVRLRDINAGSITACTSLFQFLLVRLRVTGPIGIAVASIAFQFLLVRLRGCKWWYILSSKSIFQFLLVRLRAILQEKVRALRSRISIPSGAIKSSGRERL